MINAIRKRKEEWKTGINNPYFDRTKANAIETIEEAMKKKGLKPKDLGEYFDYKKQINNLDRQWKVRNLKDKIVVFIKSIGDNKESEKSEKDLSFLDQFQDNQNHPKVWKQNQGLSIKDIVCENANNIDVKRNDEYDNWTKEKIFPYPLFFTQTSP